MATVIVNKNVPAPAPVPPATFDVTFKGLSANEVAVLRKGLGAIEGDRAAFFKGLSGQIQSQTGNTGQFYSGVTVARPAVVLNK